MDVAKFWVLKNVFPNKDPYLVPEQVYIIILVRKSYVCMAKNDNDTKHTRKIDIINHFVRNG